MDNLGKIIVASSFEWLLKVQKIVQSRHTAGCLHCQFGSPGGLGRKNGTGQDKSSPSFLFFVVGG